jgi:hypothetical protein
MKTETRMFFDHILRENRPLSEFLDAKYTFLNERLASFYGIDSVKGPEFRRVDLASNERGGLFGQASILAITSYPSRTSVVIRGKYILQNILGTPPPPPPPDVPALEEDGVGTAATLRQQMEKHRSNAVCASCHTKNGCARLRAGEFRRDRQMAHQGRQIPGRRQRHAAGRTEL